LGARMRSIPPAIASSRTLTGITAVVVLLGFSADWMAIPWLLTAVKALLAGIIVAAVLPLIHPPDKRR